MAADGDRDVPELSPEDARRAAASDPVHEFLPVAKVFKESELQIEELSEKRVTVQGATTRVRIESQELKGIYNYTSLHLHIKDFIHLLEDVTAIPVDESMQRIRRVVLETDMRRANERAPEITFELFKSGDENIMKIIGWVGSTEHMRDVTHIIFEDGKSLDQYLENTLKRLSHEEIFSFGYQLISALNHCHVQLKILHRDVNPANVYVVDSGSGFVVKLGGFVFARKQPTTVMTQERNNWVSFAAPETLDQSPLNLIPYGYSADIWSFGMVLYYMLHKKMPFNHPDTRNKKIFRNNLLKGIRPKFDPGVEPNLKRLIEACWRTEKRDSKGNVDTIAALRPTAAQIKYFINNLRDQNISNDALID